MSVREFIPLSSSRNPNQSGSASMDEPLSLVERLENPAARPLWLLAEALRCAPLGRAVELARAAEAFILDARRGPASQLPAQPESAITLHESRAQSRSTGRLVTGGASANTPPPLKHSPPQTEKRV